MFGIAGALLLISASVMEFVGVYTWAQTEIQGTPSQLEVGATYELVITNEVYAKLKGPDDVERVYAIDAKLIPSLDHWLLPRLIKRFKLEDHTKKQLVIQEIPANDPKPEEKEKK